MQGDYPRFKVTYTHEELVEHFLLVLRSILPRRHLSWGDESPWGRRVAQGRAIPWVFPR